MEIKENLKYSLLFEIYGNLLTPKQHKALLDFLDKNISLSELAQLNNTTRQAVNDLVKRSMKILDEYEEKLHLLQKFQIVKKEISLCLERAEQGDMPLNEIKLHLKKVLEVL